MLLLSGEPSEHLELTCSRPLPSGSAGLCIPEFSSGESGLDQEVLREGDLQGDLEEPIPDPARRAAAHQPEGGEEGGAGEREPAIGCHGNRLQG